LGAGLEASPPQPNSGKHNKTKNKERMVRFMENIP